MKKLFLLIFILNYSCSNHLLEIEGLEDMNVDVNGIPSDVNVEVNGIPEDITFGPDFKGVGEYCDKRYGVDTTGSEDCFLDYRNFYSVEIGFSIDSIIDFCEDEYSSGDDIEACIEDLDSLFGNINNSAEE